MGVAYAPRFKNLKRQRRYLFRSRKNVGQSEWRIKPDAYRDTDLIIAQWGSSQNVSNPVGLYVPLLEINQSGRSGR